MMSRFFLLMLLFAALVACSEDEEVTELTPVYLSTLSGEYSAEANMTAPDGAPVSCNEGFWYGRVRFDAEHEEGVDTNGVYRIYSSHEDGPMLEDPSMGGYYDCFDSPNFNPDVLPNGQDGEGLLRIYDNDGRLSWQGVSQWGEIYIMEEITPDGAVLSLAFYNDYAEVFEVRLIRDDGTSWPVELTAE